MAWIWGLNTLNPGESQRWWLWWPAYPGFETIGVQALTAGDEIQYSVPGVQQNADGSTTYFITVTNVGPTAVQYSFRGEPLSAWAWGANTLNPGESQRWWLWWPTYPGMEIIGVEATSAGGEIQWTTPGMQINGDGSATYFITVTNVSPVTVNYSFRGSAIC
jgi:hypothetical protein